MRSVCHKQIDILRILSDETSHWLSEIEEADFDVCGGCISDMRSAPNALIHMVHLDMSGDSKFVITHHGREVLREWDEIH